MTEPQASPTGEAPSRLERLAKFFTSLAGVVTAAVTLGGAVAGGVALVKSLGGDGGPTAAPPAAQPPPSPPPSPAPTPPPAPPPSPPPQGPTLSEWASRADAVCRGERSDLAAALSRMQLGLQAGSLPDMVAGMQESAGSISRMVDELERVEPPPPRSAEVARFISRWEGAAQAMQDGADAAAAGNGPAVEQAATRYDKMIAAGAELASTLGAHDCADL